MESDGDDLDHIFEEYENNENESEAANTENKSANETPGAVKVAAPKRIVKNPRLKFNADRLCGERGIPVLVDHFKNVKFKGPGHEREDLNKLLAKLEHWTHRLFPSMKFEDCLTHIEKLGKKRAVQTCLRKIRLDMPILSQDFVKDDEDNEEDNVRRNEDVEPEEINAFDRLLKESDDMSSIDVSAPENVSGSSFLHSLSTSNEPVGNVLGSSFGTSLSDEQKERMERNRMLAAERRKARLAAMEEANVRLQSEKHENLSENIQNSQNSFNHLLVPSKNNAKNPENIKSDFGINPDNDEILKKSSKLNHEDSEELGLDDLMNLVDEDDPVSNENATGLPLKQAESSYDNVDEIDNNSLIDTENLKNNCASKNVKNKVISSPESSPGKKLNIDSTIYETSLNSKIKTDSSVNDTLTNEENIMGNSEDFTSMDCEVEKSQNDSSNIKKIEKSKDLLSVECKEEKSQNNNGNVSEIGKSEILTYMACEDENFQDNSNINKIEKNEDLISMDCEDEKSRNNNSEIEENENLTSMDCEGETSQEVSCNSNEFPANVTETIKNFEDISENNKNEILSSSTKSETSAKENLNMCETSVDSEISETN